MFCLQQVACIFSLVAAIVGTPELEDASQMLSCLSNVVYCRYDLSAIKINDFVVSICLLSRKNVDIHIVSSQDW